MSCSKFAALVHELVDDRLPAKLAQELRSHATECDVCARLLDADRWLVEAVNHLDVPRPPSGRLAARIAQSLEGLAALERRDQVFPAAAAPRQNNWVRWVALAALILLSVTVGLMLGRQFDGAPGAQSPSISKQAEPAKEDRAAKDTHLPNTWARVESHMNSAQALTQQVLQLKNPKLARPILSVELKQSKLKKSTPELRSLLLQTRPASEGFTVYLAKTDKLVRIVDRWVHTDDQPLRTIQVQLRADGLLEQISSLRQQVDVGMQGSSARRITGTRLIYSSDPMYEMYFQSRARVYKGQYAQALIIIQELERKFPGNALRGNTRYWKKVLKQKGHFRIVADEIRIEGSGTQGFQQIKRIRQSARLVFDGRTYKLRNPQPTVLAFYQLWAAGKQHDQIKHFKLQTQSGPSLRVISLTFRATAKENPPVLARFNELQSVSGVSRRSFPRRMQLFALEKDCPRYMRPEKQN